MTSSHGAGSSARAPFPTEARPVVEAYLAAIDAHLPDRLSAFYLVGSIALGDYRPGASDIDFVAVTPTLLVNTELETLAALHVVLHAAMPSLFLSGIYVTPDDLLRDPRTLTAVPDFIAFTIDDARRHSAR
jgi:predicted nucleotidyltransferase